MNRAIVIKSYGDQQIAGAIVDGMSRAPALNAAELKTVRAENIRLKALTGVRSCGDSVRLETACKALAVKSQLNPLDGCTGPFWARGRYCGLACLDGWNISGDGIGVDNMGACAEVGFEKVCPACDAGCPFLELKRCDAFAGNILFDRCWYCANRDMCKRLWERMEAINNVRPD